MLRPDVLIATKATYKNGELVELREFCGTVVVLEPQAETSTSAKVRRLMLGHADEICAGLVFKGIGMADRKRRRFRKERLEGAQRSVAVYDEKETAAVSALRTSSRTPSASAATGRATERPM